MRVLITGATGFIGQALCRHLCGDYELVAPISRRAQGRDNHRTLRPRCRMGWANDRPMGLGTGRGSGRGEPEPAKTSAPNVGVGRRRLASARAESTEPVPCSMRSEGPGRNRPC